MYSLDHIISDIPTSIGMENALRRAQQLAQLRWTPIRPMPAIVPSGMPGVNAVPVCFPAWRPQVGVNYSAARFDEKYIGCNVSLETYMTALSNPDSVLYTRSLHGKHRLSAAYYGTVCSQFASYVMDLPFHIDCQQWPYLEGMEQIDPLPLENLRLCDILNDPIRHTAVITGIDRDSSGKVVSVTVTESTQPRIQSNTFTPREFEEAWLKKNFSVLRYGKLDRVTYTPDPWVPLPGDPVGERPLPNPTLMPDHGDRANYLLGEPVTLSVFDRACTAVEIFRGGERIAALPLPEEGRVCYSPPEPGYYRAQAVGGAQRSGAVSFCVVSASAETDRRSYEAGETVKVTLSCVSDDPLLGWVVKTSGFSKYWGYFPGDDGVMPTETVLPAGEYLIIALYRNEYGVYSSPPSPVFCVGMSEKKAD